MPLTRSTTAVPTLRLTLWEPAESRIQSSFIEWLRWREHSLPVLKLGFSIPNGGGRDIRVAARMKAEGTRRGVPDWHLPVARGGFCGLWIEFKKPSGVMSVEQRDYIGLLKAEGHRVEVCRSPDDAINAVKNYLGG